MNITSFKSDGPSLDAGLPMPCPVDETIAPYPWDDFVKEMQSTLEDYAESDMCALSIDAILRSITPDGTCYWIRADLDTGPRFLRVHVTNECRGGDLPEFQMSPCREQDVPGRLRLN